jgi:drug/metabolite transporter (DMT)-like permease
MPYAGEIAALTTAVCWTFTSLFFTEAGRRVGSFRVNAIRLLLAVCIYALVLFLSTGHVWPEDINNRQFFWLALSGLIGLVIGDGFGFKALVMIGPRLTTLMWSTAPIMVTIIAWFFLGEQLTIVDIIGIVVAVSGIAWVVAERRYPGNNRFDVKVGHPDHGSLWKGILYGLIAAFGQGLGLVLSKQGMLYAGGTVEALPASFIRMFCSMVMIWVLCGLRGQFIDTIKAMKLGRVMLFSGGGAFFGPFFGVWMSLVAVRHIEAGIAATLNAMTPIFIIPVVILVYKEKVSLRAVLGAILAVVGVALLFLSDEVSRLL